MFEEEERDQRMQERINALRELLGLEPLVEVATKTQAENGRRARDHLGRVIDKPFGPSRDKDEKPRRTPSGKRVSKPFARKER